MTMAPVDFVTTSRFADAGGMQAALPRGGARAGGVGRRPCRW